MHISHADFDQAYYFEGLRRSTAKNDVEYLRRKKIRAARELNAEKKKHRTGDGLWFLIFDLSTAKRELALAQEIFHASDTALKPLQSHLRRNVDTVVIEHSIDSSCMDFWASDASRFDIRVAPDGRKAAIRTKQPYYGLQPMEIATIVAKNIRHTLEHVGAKDAWHIRRRGARINLLAKG